VCTYSCPAVNNDGNPLIESQSTATTCVYQDPTTSSACSYVVNDENPTSPNGPASCPAELSETYCPNTDSDGNALDGGLTGYATNQYSLDECGPDNSEYDCPNEISCTYTLPGYVITAGSAAMGCPANYGGRNFYDPEISATYMGPLPFTDTSYFTCHYYNQIACEYDSEGAGVSGNDPTCPANQDCSYSVNKKRAKVLRSATARTAAWKSRGLRAKQFMKSNAV